MLNPSELDRYDNMTDKDIILLMGHIHSLQSMLSNEHLELMRWGNKYTEVDHSNYQLWEFLRNLDKQIRSYLSELPSYVGRSE